MVNGEPIRLGGDKPNLRLVGESVTRKQTEEEKRETARIQKEVRDRQKKSESKKESEPIRLGTQRLGAKPQKKEPKLEKAVRELEDVKVELRGRKKTPSVAVQQFGAGLSSSVLGTALFAKQIIGSPVKTVKGFGKGTKDIPQRLRGFGKLIKEQPFEAGGFLTGELLLAKGGGTVVKAGKKVKRAKTTKPRPQIEFRTKVTPKGDISVVETVGKTTVGKRKIIGASKELVKEIDGSAVGFGRSFDVERLTKGVGKEVITKKTIIGDVKPLGTGKAVKNISNIDVKQTFGEGISARSLIREEAKLEKITGLRIGIPETLRLRPDKKLREQRVIGVIGRGKSEGQFGFIGTTDKVLKTTRPKTLSDVSSVRIKTPNIRGKIFLGSQKIDTGSGVITISKTKLSPSIKTTIGKQIAGLEQGLTVTKPIKAIPIKTPSIRSVQIKEPKLSTGSLKLQGSPITKINQKEISIPKIDVTPRVKSKTKSIQRARSSQSVKEVVTPRLNLDQGLGLDSRIRQVPRSIQIPRQSQRPRELFRERTRLKQTSGQTPRIRIPSLRIDIPKIPEVPKLKFTLNKKSKKKKRKRDFFGISDRGLSESFTERQLLLDLPKSLRRFR